MKRGLIAREIPREVFEARLGRVRKELDARKLPALLVYSDVWRSNQGRFLTNFMPYWNRSLIVIPREGAPVLLCALSPRVYPWIKSVTVFDDIRPAPKLMAKLEELCVEKGWYKLGVLDLMTLPLEIRQGMRPWEVVDVPSQGLLETDYADFAMRRKALELARGVELTDAVGELERALRRAGAEDLVIRVKRRDELAYSVELALEYCGHWVKVTRAHGPAQEVEELRQRFHAALLDGSGYRENLAGAQPYESGTGSIYALRVEHNGLYYGDTCSGTGVL